MYALNLMRIALELAGHNHVYEDIASKFFEHFVYIWEAMNNLGGEHIELWDSRDGFYYDVLTLPDGRRTPLKARSMVGLIPLFAVETLEPAEPTVVAVCEAATGAAGPVHHTPARFGPVAVSARAGGNRPGRCPGVSGVPSERHTRWHAEGSVLPGRASAPRNGRDTSPWSPAGTGRLAARRRAWPRNGVQGPTPARPARLGPVRNIPTPLTEAPS